MRRAFHSALLLSCLGFVLVSTAYAQSPGRIGVHLGVGTDVSGGIAYGGQIDYTLPKGPNSLELGLTLFAGSFEEDSNNGFNDYYETTDILVGAGMANYLFRHAIGTGGPYFVAGVGAGAFSVEWREESPTDTSLGLPLSGGGSFQEEDGLAAGFILNLGIGHRFTEQFDIRAQAPTFFIGGGDERDSQVVPTFTLTLGIGF